MRSCDPFHGAVLCAVGTRCGEQDRSALLNSSLSKLSVIANGGLVKGFLTVFFTFSHFQQVAQCELCICDNRLWKASIRLFKTFLCFYGRLGTEHGKTSYRGIFEAYRGILARAYMVTCARVCVRVRVRTCVHVCACVCVYARVCMQDT